MQARIIKIGNSRGIRIPKPLLDQSGIRDHVELEVSENQIIIRPVGNPRHGWDQAFSTMAAKGDDAPLDQAEILATEWDEDGWQW